MLKPWLALPLLAGMGGLAATGSTAAETLVLATTTSTQDSGLLDALLPAFESQTGIRVRTVAVGSGEAIAMGCRGDADVLLAHSPAAEETLMAEGHGALRLAVMHNDFVLAGPAADPAQVRGADAVTAFHRIAAAGAPFASRGDRSGTHVKERELWQKAGVDPAGRPWYVSTGQGMGETARIASEKRAYLLMDRGTYLALRPRLALAVLAEGGPDLANPYHVIVVNPAKHPRVHAGAARRFAEWLTGPEARRLIAEFGRARYGRPLFVPDAR